MPKPALTALPGTTAAPQIRRNRTPELAHGVSTFLLAAGFLLGLTILFTDPEAAWPQALLLVLAAVSTGTALWRQLPGQNVLSAAVVIALIGTVASVLGVRTAIPFGPFVFGPDTGPLMFNSVPWLVPFLWFALVLNSRGVARLILRPWRKTRTYGLWLIGLTALIVVVLELALDPFAAHLRHYWIWEETKLPLTWLGAPMVNFIGCVVVTLMILAFATPALINKQLSKHSKPDYHPLVVWLGAMIFCGVATAMHGLWLVVAVDAVLATGTTIFAIRGGKW